jgi:hypothetical protein
VRRDDGRAASRERDATAAAASGGDVDSSTAASPVDRSDGEFLEAWSELPVEVISVTSSARFEAWPLGGSLTGFAGITLNRAAF